MAEAAAEAVDLAGDLLDAGAGGADDPNGAGARDVGEGERGAGEHGGAAVRAHDEQAELGGALLEGDLVGQAYVVGEDHDAQARLKELVADGGGVLAGHGDECEVGGGLLVQGAGEAAHAHATGGGGGGGLLGEELSGALGDGAVGVGVVRVDGEDKVAGAGGVELG